MTTDFRDGRYGSVRNIWWGFLILIPFLWPAGALAQEDFAIAVLPDTQNYASGDGGGTPEIFKAQTQWIAENRESLNIVYVAHLGDCVNHADRDDEWRHADEAFRKLEGTPPIPYGIAVGNHDKYIYRRLTDPHRRRPYRDDPTLQPLLRDGPLQGQTLVRHRTTGTTTTISTTC